MTLRILTVGDLIGRPGRMALQTFLPQLKDELGVDFVIANGENAAGGIGLTPETAHEILAYGIDAITTGNHIWAHKEIIPLLEGNLPIMRPLNYPPGAPGKGFVENGPVTVVNLLGNTFIGNLDCPFRTMDRFLSEWGTERKIIIVDFHAEATSEKVALGRYLDGRVTAVLGTHTHVGTIDACLLPKGTAYVTDIGMTGPVDSVIGCDVDKVISKFLTGIPRRLSVGKGDEVFNAVLVEADAGSGRALNIQRIQKSASC